MSDGYNPDDTIFVRIDKAFQEIASKNLKKSKTSGTGSYAYNFIPISDILDVVRPAHAKYGVKVIPSRVIFDEENCETRTLNTGKILANGHIVFRIVGKSMEDSIEASISCEALDNSDKTTNKLITNAERGLYRAMYGLDEGDDTDPEAYHVKLNEEGVQKSSTPKVVPSADKGPDKFFGSKAKADKSASQTSPMTGPSAQATPSKSDLDIILDAESNPKLKGMVIEWKRKNGVHTLYETLPEQRAELAEMVRSVA